MAKSSGREVKIESTARKSTQQTENFTDYALVQNSENVILETPTLENMLQDYVA